MPTVCYVGQDGEKFYQYTVIDEATRERFIYAYREASSYSAVDFVQRAIRYFDYAPEIIQTDNGCVPGFISFIRPFAPGHPGTMGRSHRSNQERFYNYLSFYSCEDLQIQMKRYLRRSNRIPMSVLGWKTPIQKRQELEIARFC